MLHEVKNHTTKRASSVMFLKMGNILMPSYEWFFECVFRKFGVFWIFVEGSMRRRKIKPFESMEDRLISCEKLKDISKGQASTSATKEISLIIFLLRPVQTAEIEKLCHSQ